MDARVFLQPIYSNLGWSLFLVTDHLVFSQPDGWQVQEVSDFGAQNCQSARKFDWKTELDLTTERQISYTRC